MTTSALYVALTKLVGELADGGSQYETSQLERMRSDALLIPLHANTRRALELARGRAQLITALGRLQVELSSNESFRSK